MKKFSLTLLTISLTLISCSSGSGEFTAEEKIRQDVEWLASDDRGGRLAGSEHEAASANYIADRFLQLGLNPAGDGETYFQQFTLAGPMAQSMGVEDHLSRNVVGTVAGSENPGQVIILGAHYDGQGHGGTISLNHENPDSLHNSADDNASGVAGLMHLAREISEEPLSKSVLFVAFSGEELGLLGSRYFADNLQISPDSVLAMINFDMIGRLTEEELTIFGTGTSSQWDEILSESQESGLNIRTNPSGTGASDHSSFHDIGIPVLHYFTGTHDDYHRGSDTPNKVNADGILAVSEHALGTLRELSAIHADEMDFTATESQQQNIMSGDSVTMGVLPDYTYSGEGFRIEGVRDGGAAAEAGLQGGDVILQMGEIEITDIYGYMEALGEFTSGEEIVVKVRRSGEIKDLTLTFK
ncbi:M20/M25/M40 family metallo-hydrolase [Rhodohalobacter sp.]|uniref:M20/M25/M40 family metallo-hydrolase n=1 Tax=Rhodohalobacter sp. TaxID=1974210 RepID=UPI002ACDB7EC|nr:M20/M25/M40 family metallo-hydrolase [Rhodohalobacter sp.]MDZ7755231.1 M28 family peptidase [Rhodohalobacter sp.]